MRRSIRWADWREKSLVRGNALVIVSLIAAFALSHFPYNQPSLWLILPTCVAALGTVDTLRCMQPRWSWYHGGVLLCVYMDLMVVTLILFFLVYPYLGSR
ncbi:hypothetical protein [Terriglobus saanensis]|uniref:Uncharacterized protein n=1 Tax=Terriglobus saanensis (strain ATCC BAA-1853 / DSM 23119 / SP1PR4) TaxID=401053 RepID=E8V4U5_TERSS|nr:hypothetical protein [Terriglobus saanensis]ADV82573.1 hypothetical protein AciPR4_1767 [Terriglobus saanensis SP1PR4]